MSTSTFVCFLHQYDTMRRGKTTSSSRMKSNRLHQIYTMSLWVTELQNVTKIMTNLGPRDSPGCPATTGGLAKESDHE